VRSEICSGGCSASGHEGRSSLNREDPLSRSSDISGWRIEPATPETFTERAGWRYEPPYDFYNDDGEPVKNPERFLAVRDETGRLVGFYYFEQRGEGLFFGLGLRPDLTGRGFGLEFVEMGLAFAHERWPGLRVVLDVAEFNVRARTVYERAGFVVVGSHVRHFVGWGDVTFIDLEER
jgi:[ribosomal protein S18]-alanine N-acetyltransferase